MDINSFREELERIKDPEIGELTQRCLEVAPLHFWYRPASSTGKYHAKDENEQGGLIIHTLRVCRIAEIYIEAWLPPLRADIVRSACILHDLCKYGEGYSASKYTLNNHPQLAAAFVRRIGNGSFNQDKVRLISDAIAAHMGKWGPPFEPEPENLAVHLADMVATKIYEER